MPLLKGAGPLLLIAPEAVGFSAVIAETTRGVTPVTKAATTATEVSGAKEDILV